jgi:hypothetical protein
MCVYSLPQRIRSNFLLNHETEECVKEEYTINYIYWFNDSKWIYE